MSTDTIAVARWLNSNLGYHEGFPGWESYVDGANEILGIIDLANTGTASIHLTTSGWLLRKPDGELSLHRRISAAMTAVNAY